MSSIIDNMIKELIAEDTAKIERLKEVIAEMLKYHRGEDPYDYSGESDVALSMELDWMNIEEMLENALAEEKKDGQA